MKIDLVPGAIPYKSRVRPLNPDQQEKLWDQIDEWLEQGVIKPSRSPSDLTSGTHEEEGWMDEMGHRS